MSCLRDWDVSCLLCLGCVFICKLTRGSLARVVAMSFTYGAISMHILQEAFEYC